MSSPAMELEGLKRSLKALTDDGLQVKALVTDQHASINKYMRDEYQHTIAHYLIAGTWSRV